MNVELTQMTTFNRNYLYKLYGAIFDVNVQKIGDLYSVEFRIEFVNKKYLPKIKKVTNLNDYILVGLQFICKEVLKNNFINKK